MQSLVAQEMIKELQDSLKEWSLPRRHCCMDRNVYEGIRNTRQKRCHSREGGNPEETSVKLECMLDSRLRGNDIILAPLFVSILS